MLAFSITDRQTKKEEWTSYSANVFAKPGDQADFYRSVLVEGSVVEITGENIKVDVYQGQNGQSITLELLNAKPGDEKPNFDVNGNSLVIPDDRISCSERMPEQGAYISAVSRHGEYVAEQVIDNWLDLHDGTSFELDEVYLWMMLPPLPAVPQQ